MATERAAEPTEAQIAVHWKEEEYVRPSAKFIGPPGAKNPRFPNTVIVSIDCSTATHQ